MLTSIRTTTQSKPTYKNDRRKETGRTNNKKAKKTFVFDLPLDAALIKTFVGKTQLASISSNHRGAEINIYPPGYNPDPQYQGLWLVRASCRNKTILESLANDMIDRYNNIVQIVRKLRSSVEEAIEDEEAIEGGEVAKCSCCRHHESDTD